FYISLILLTVKVAVRYFPNTQYYLMKDKRLLMILFYTFCDEVLLDNVVSTRIWIIFTSHDS
ncbi:Hypothetical predicted protein, partial [Marmota monax]